MTKLDVRWKNFVCTKVYSVLNVLNNFGIPYTVVHDFDVTEFGKNQQGKSSSTLRQALTINFKIEALSDARENKKFVLQYTFEDEMPDTYEKGTSKSFATYEYLMDKSLIELPQRFLEIVKAAYGIPLEVPMSHRVDELIQQYILQNPTWVELKEAYREWKKPNVEEFIKKVWVTSEPYAAAAMSPQNNN